MTTNLKPGTRVEMRVNLKRELGVVRPMPRKWREIDTAGWVPVRFDSTGKIELHPETGVWPARKEPA